MNSKILIPIVIAAIAIIGIGAILPSDTESEQTTPHNVDFTYSDLGALETAFASKDIYMSSPTPITDHTIDAYCTFFDGDKQQSVKYCETTALLNLAGDTIGNFNMGGASDVPIMALALLDSKSLDSKKDQIHFVFKTTIESLVCDCWEDQQPGGFESVSQWIDAAGQKYKESGQITLKSTIDGIDNKQVMLEITSTGNSYLWTLIILK